MRRSIRSRSRVRERQGKNKSSAPRHLSLLASHEYGVQSCLQVPRFAIWAHCMRAQNIHSVMSTQRHTKIAFASVADIFIPPARSFVFQFVKNPPFPHRSRGSESQIFDARVMKKYFCMWYVTMHKTWIHHYTPESNRQSAEWTTKSEIHLKRSKTQMSAGKVFDLHILGCERYFIHWLAWEKKNHQ